MFETLYELDKKGAIKMDFSSLYYLFDTEVEVNDVGIDALRETKNVSVPIEFIVDGLVKFEQYLCFF